MEFAGEEAFGELLARYRTQARWSQERLAACLSVHRSTVVKWELKGGLPKDRTRIDEIARCLHLTDRQRDMLLRAALFVTSEPIWSVPEDVEAATWPRCQHYLSQAQACAGLIQEYRLADEEATQLLNRAAVYLYTHALYGQALPLYQRALAIREQTLGPDHPRVPTVLNNLALLHRAQGQDAEALPLYQRALAIDERALGPDHPDVAQSLNNLASLYQDQEQYEQALPLYQRALAIDERTLGPDHPDVAQSLNNLASLYQDQGQYEQALPLYQRALAIDEQALGSDHPDVASVLDNLVSLLQAMQQPVQAAGLAARAQTIRATRRQPT